MVPWGPDGCLMANRRRETCRGFQGGFRERVRKCKRLKPELACTQRVTKTTIALSKRTGLRRSRWKAAKGRRDGEKGGEELRSSTAQRCGMQRLSCKHRLEGEADVRGREGGKGVCREWQRRGSDDAEVGSRSRAWAVEERWRRARGGRCC